MTLAHIDAALGAYFRHKSGKDGIVGNPLPMLAEILALGDADRRDAARLRAALVEIRDSTFRNAATLRGMADWALTAIDAAIGQAAGGGEAVAWQYRSCCSLMLKPGEWSQWTTVIGPDEATARSKAASRPDLYQVRPLYTRPASRAVVDAEPFGAEFKG